MARPMKPLVRGGGYYPSRRWTPLVYPGGYTTMDGGEEPGPPTPVYWKTITGVSPLALANALQEHIRSLTQYGKCVQSGTPTPVAPVDILCNNGALKCSRNMLDPSTSNIFIGEIVYEPGGTAESPQNWRTGFIPVVGGKTYIFYGRRKSDDLISAYNRINWYTADGTNISPRPSYTKDTPTVGTAPSNAAYVRLSCAPYNSTKPITRATFDEFNWMFAEAAQEIPYTPYAEGGIYCGGTPEVLTVRTNNLVDVAHLTPVNLAYSANRLMTNAERYGYYIKVKPNTKYTISINREKTGAYLNICDTTYVPANNVSVQAYNNMDGETASKTITTTATTNWLYVYTAAISPFTNGDFQIEEGQTATPYAPYHRETASVPMLLGVGDYKDAAELIEGLLTHKIGVYVFNGTESWNVRKAEGGKTTLQLASVSKIPYIIADDVVGLSTHLAYLGVVTGIDSVYAKGMGFVFFKSSLYPNARNVYVNIPSTVATTEAETQSWLASEYANGTPVILVYPLATETTEQTTAHELNTTEGTNVVSAATNVDPVTLAVEYASSEE